ncbi:MAG: hypothetical protein AAF517_08160, partial [Planctomycetota bacterium]
NPNAINIYVNNSESGQCALVGNGSLISMGSSIFERGTVLHEIGHFFDLRHTHVDTNCSTADTVADGDGLAATIPDHGCRTVGRDKLSELNFGVMTYAALSEDEKAQVDSSFLNVMSYHEEEVLLAEQMDIWALNANDTRAAVCNGRTWFVSPVGSDQNSGIDASFPLRTIPTTLSKVRSQNDVILLNGGRYSPQNGITLRVPCTLRATHGTATIR